MNVRVVAKDYAGNVIRRLIFNKRYFGKGIEDGGPGLEEVEYMKAIFTVLECLFAFFVSDFMPCLRGFDMDGHERIMKEACKGLVLFTPISDMNTNERLVIPIN